MKNTATAATTEPDGDDSEKQPRHREPRDHEETHVWSVIFIYVVIWINAQRASVPSVHSAVDVERESVEDCLREIAFKIAMLGAVTHLAWHEARRNRNFGLWLALIFYEARGASANDLVRRFGGSRANRNRQCREMKDALSRIYETHMRLEQIVTNAALAARVDLDSDDSIANLRRAASLLSAMNTILITLVQIAEDGHRENRDVSIDLAILARVAANKDLKHPSKNWRKLPRCTNLHDCLRTAVAPYDLDALLKLIHASCRETLNSDDKN